MDELTLQAIRRVEETNKELMSVVVSLSGYLKQAVSTSVPTYQVVGERIEERAEMVTDEIKEFVTQRINEKTAVFEEYMKQEMSSLTAKLNSLTGIVRDVSLQANSLESRLSELENRDETGYKSDRDYLDNEINKLRDEIENTYYDEDAVEDKIKDETREIKSDISDLFKVIGKAERLINSISAFVHEEDEREEDEY